MDKYIQLSVIVCKSDIISMSNRSQLLSRSYWRRPIILIFSFICLFFGYSGICFHGFHCISFLVLLVLQLCVTPLSETLCLSSCLLKVWDQHVPLIRQTVNCESTLVKRTTNQPLKTFPYDDTVHSWVSVPKNNRVQLFCGTTHYLKVMTACIYDHNSKIHTCRNKCVWRWEAQTGRGRQTALRDGPTHCWFWFFHEICWQ